MTTNKPTLYVSKRNFDIYLRVLDAVKADALANFSDWVLEACRMRLDGDLSQPGFDIDALAEEISRRLNVAPAPVVQDAPREALGWFK